MLEEHMGRDRMRRRMGVWEIIELGVGMANGRV